MKSLNQNMTATSILHYNLLISSIPTIWKRELKGDKGSCLTDTDISHLMINIKELTNKIVYDSLTYEHGAPSAEMKWVEYCPMLEVLDWKSIYLEAATALEPLHLPKINPFQDHCCKM